MQRLWHFYNTDKIREVWYIFQLIQPFRHCSRRTQTLCQFDFKLIYDHIDRASQIISEMAEVRFCSDIHLQNFKIINGTRKFKS